MGGTCASCDPMLGPSQFNASGNRPCKAGDLSDADDSDDELYPPERACDEENANTDTSTGADPRLLIGEWKKAVDSSNNSHIKNLVTLHYKEINLLRIKWHNGDNTLHRACATNNLKLIKVLLKLKLNINEINEINGNAGIHYAALNGHEKVVELLMSIDTIDLRIRNKNGNTALDISQSPNSANLKVEKLLLQGISSNIQLLGAPQKSLRGSIDSIGNISNIGGISVSYSTVSSSDGNTSDSYSSGNNIGQLESIASGSGSSSNIVSNDAQPPAYFEGSEIDKSGWIDKKKSKFPHTFVKRHVIICQGYLLWNRKMIDMSDKELSNINI